MPMSKYPERSFFPPGWNKLSDEVAALRAEVEILRALAESDATAAARRKARSEMDPRLRASLVKAEALETLERIKPIVWEVEKQKILRDRRKRIHERAKRTLARLNSESAAKRPDLIYKTRVQKRDDDV
jgi:hypothetical protein